MGGLRFDKVAVGLVERVRAAVSDAVPPGITVALTVTAPIRMGSKTSAALEEKIRVLLGQRRKASDVTATMQGNRVRIRLIKSDSGSAPQVLGFVHNPGADSRLILDVAGSTLRSC